MKETCQTEIWKETALIELRFFFIDILAFEQANYALGWGFCFVFLTRGRSFALKSCPWGGDFEGKN